MNSECMSSTPPMRFAAVLATAAALACGPTLARADLVNIGKTDGGGLGVGVNVGKVKVGVTVGDGSVAKVDADVVGVDATAEVGGSSTASVCVGACNTTTTPPGTIPGTTPVTPVVSRPVTPVPTAPPVVPKVLACATAEGNTTAFNGYPLYDRDGRMLGIIHSAVMDGQAKIKSVSIRSVSKTCTSIGKTGFTVAGYAITGAFDARKSGLAFTN